jgi:uncharacterized protein
MSKSTTNKKRKGSASSRSVSTGGSSSSEPSVISARWLLTNIGLLIIIATICAWLTLCLLFWQGSWQLLYHPSSAVTLTPASVKLAFQDIRFFDSDTGVPQLQGWWIPAGSQARYTALYLHGGSGNLSDSVDDLAQLHAAGLNVFTFDYRGYGASIFKHPSELRMREDVNAALLYLTGTRHVAASSIVLVGKDLGANLALKVAASRPELAGVVVENLIDSPVDVIFNDPRTHIVPARFLVRDRWDAAAPAANLLLPSLWFYWKPADSTRSQEDDSPFYQAVKARKTLVWLINSPDAEKNFHSALTRWLDDLAPSRQSK